MLSGIYLYLLTRFICHCLTTSFIRYDVRPQQTKKIPKWRVVLLHIFVQLLCWSIFYFYWL